MEHPEPCSGIYNNTSSNAKCSGWMTRFRNPEQLRRVLLTRKKLGDRKPDQIANTEGWGDFWWLLWRRHAISLASRELSKTCSNCTGRRTRRRYRILDTNPSASNHRKSIDRNETEELDQYTYHSFPEQFW